MKQIPAFIPERISSQGVRIGCSVSLSAHAKIVTTARAKQIKESDVVRQMVIFAMEHMS